MPPAVGSAQPDHLSCHFCNGYIDRSHPTIQEMEEIAWVLRSDPKRNQMGFVRASELKPKDRYVLPDEWM